LKDEKNQALLFHAFALLLETVDARLMLLGEGPLRGKLEALSRKLGVADKIVMPGFVTDPAPFYRTADLFVLSSDYEGFGNVIVEALACGLPAVSTDCPSGPAEILENGRFGQLTPVGDAVALADAMAESLAAEHDREALRRRAADFSPARAAKQYLQLLFPEPIGGMYGRR
jgi:glycosyltransferase involved in cell wall biosynthesis